MSADGLTVAVSGVEPAAITLPEHVSLAATPGAAELVVAVGESGLFAVRDAGCPVLPVAAGRGVRSVPREAVADALAAVAAGDHEAWSIPKLSVWAEGERLDDALFDVMAVTERPAHISEYTVRTPAETVDRFRADGVHLATAAGTAGYARRVDAPVFDPSTPAAAVVPIAPFAIDPDHWVVPVDDPLLEVTVERDEAAVTLLADDRTVGPVTPQVPVTVRPDGDVTLYAVPQSRPVFDSPDGSPRQR